MKLQEALDIIENSKKEWFMVAFEKRDRSMLTSGHFPDVHAGEAGIETEDEAWDLARKFAAATKALEYVNIYVIGKDFAPVADYNRHKMHAYSPGEAS